MFRYSLISFFEPLKLFLNALGMGETLAVDLEKKFLVMSLLFEKYEQLFEKLFVRDDELSRYVVFLRSRHSLSALSQSLWQIQPREC